MRISDWSSDVCSSDLLMARGGQLPDRTQLERAAAILNQAEKPFILVGQGALGAGQELLEMAEKLGAPIGKALLGKGAVPDLSDYSTGGVGLLGTRPSQDALEVCETLLIVGSSFPYIEYSPSPGAPRRVLMETIPQALGLPIPATAE